jgi:hypothetical protein
MFITSFAEDKIYPSLKSFGTPLYKGAIQNVLRDIISVMKSSSEKDHLTFTLFNEAVCSLVHIPSSASYNQFKRKVKQTK